METSLKDRHRVGVDDFILLEDYTNINAFVENLKKRLNEDIIYTSIGSVLVSVNPYKQLPIYTQQKLTQYKESGFLWLPPHIFGLVDTAYRSLTEENRPQCILISGESGSGKTEASKKVLQFIAEATGHQKVVEDVKDKLLQSNPLLEAFGNAKTNKNDNSSRFGKYMDVEFNFRGEPIGGKILNYLLEKSRVVHQSIGERNFHIFYQLLSGSEESYLDSLHLNRAVGLYSFLNHKESGNEIDTSDAEQFKHVKEALNTIQISESDQKTIFSIVASILHLGNIIFIEENDISHISVTESVQIICKLLGCNEEQFKNALTKRTIEAVDDVVVTPLNKELSIYARNALAKAIYSRLFSWLVAKLNYSLHPFEDFSQNTVMGILDIYGFEVFDKNSYEQFCINYCNEKLQQLFIELTLKGEQEEYLQEGIEWIPIDYFNNKVICELIEEKHKGIICMLNEECLRPGVITDQSFLEKMNKNLATHRHYISHLKSDTKTQKTMNRDEFRLVHYAGEVIYNVSGFIEKNNDLLFRDLVELMANSTNSVIKAIFTLEELNSKKRPDTAINQFKNSLNKLMEILLNKDPSYIRCIKPNDFQQQNIFDDELVKHQVKYLGLMGNLKVRRAGFAYRRPYDVFLKRYKALSKHTWPNYYGLPRDGVKLLINDLGLKEDEYGIGKTKVFIRSPATLFRIEDDFQLKKHEIATIIQKMWKGRQERIKYEKMKQAIVEIQKLVRGFIARRRVERLKQAIKTIRRFIKGFITRYGPETDLNKAFIQFIRAKWLMNLSKRLPSSVLDKSWPPCPKICEEASVILRDLRMKQLALKYRSTITPERKRKFQEKVLAEFLFKGRKRSYDSSISDWFLRERLTQEQHQFMLSFQKKYLSDDKLLYSTSVTKYDRHGYKDRNRVLIFTNKYIYLLDGKTFKLKHKILYKNITELTVTTEGDNFLLVRISPELKKDKGDLILAVPNLIEAVTMFVDLTQKPKILKITNDSKITHYLSKGKPGTIKIVLGSIGSIPEICKNSGELVIMG